MQYLIELNCFTGTSSLVGLSDVTDNKLIWRQLIAELLGTFLLTSIGVAACISLTTLQTPQTTSIALAFGLLVASIVQVCDIYFVLYDKSISIKA